MSNKLFYLCLFVFCFFSGKLFADVPCDGGFPEVPWNCTDTVELRFAQYPNPVGNSVNIQRFEKNNGVLYFDVNKSNLRTGIYFISVKFNSEKFVKKIEVVK